MSIQDPAPHEKFMTVALRLAYFAYLQGEVPVGALIVRDGKILSAAHNRREVDHSAIAHAEILAIESACRKIGNWRLAGCTLYSTLEMCPMCAGAVLNARIPRIVIGARDSIGGAAGSVSNLLDGQFFSFCPEIIFGIKEYECSKILKSFFADLRAGKFRT